jgi:hypothetical protein
MTPTIQAFRSRPAIELRGRLCKACVRTASGFKRSLGITGIGAVGVVNDRREGMHMGMDTAPALLIELVQGRMAVAVEARPRGIDEG